MGRENLNEGKVTRGTQKRKRRRTVVIQHSREEKVQIKNHFGRTKGKEETWVCKKNEWVSRKASEQILMSGIRKGGGIV